MRNTARGETKYDLIPSLGETMNVTMKVGNTGGGDQLMIYDYDFYIGYGNGNIYLYFRYSQFHETLPRSCLQMHWSSIRFYEMVDT